MHKVVLVRHGESAWNKENRFTGWTDVDLSEKGVQEAHEGGAVLRAEGYTFDLAYTSVLKRAIRTLWIVLDEMDLMWIPVHRSWRLNERHYGALQGLNKAETAAKFGAEQVHVWRRSYDVAPPGGESLKDTAARTLPYFEANILPDLRAGKNVLVSAHGNSLRSIVMQLDQLNKEEVMALNLATGVPIVYEFSPDLKILSKRILDDC